MPQTRIVQLLFYQAQPNDHFMNRLVSWFDPPYVHVEIRFEDGMASSVYAGETVFFRNRTYANPHYRIETFTVEDRDYQAMYRHCRLRAAHNVGFDGLGMYLAILPLISRNPPDRTFCSRYVTEVLQLGNVPEFVMLTPCRTTPSMLFKAVRSSNRTLFSSVPFKIELAVQGACGPQDLHPGKKRRGTVTEEGIVPIAFTPRV
ncbi:hypothetical protein GUITHDRAFT_118758 [Guillardia theta CCMP2712]|uniref:Uncharacterized protein n=1 Tax=Guillardia theta (strain CCMP2712) TaxID=905079 RepID=L1IGZ5_GUITC|nr:hypothetical protein GUITHDRAFT_118758 [Guillardia theta CCMP2712]EKX35105.1 hypothetical protein GUITHDRAFT_118758 [Guillardia theta CCMP2712]|eukprot:XP_005822085.1 hypothetical protein GUITHDRAFT_118758 [Guillardia theta CCMP2712]